MNRLVGDALFSGDGPFVALRCVLLVCFRDSREVHQRTRPGQVLIVFFASLSSPFPFLSYRISSLLDLKTIVV